MNPFTHTYTHSLSHTHTRTHARTRAHARTHTHTHTSITVSGIEGYWDGKRCVFRADVKVDAEFGWNRGLIREFVILTKS